MDIVDHVDKDQFIRDWLENLEVCKVIEKRENEISKCLRKALKVKHPGVSLGGRPRNCYGKGSDEATETSWLFQMRN